MKDMEEELKKIKREREEEASSNRRAEAELEATQRQLNELLRYLVWTIFLQISLL